MLHLQDRKFFFGFGFCFGWQASTSLGLQASTRTYAVQIAVYVKLQQIARVITRGRPVTFGSTRQKPAACKSSCSTNASTKRAALSAPMYSSTEFGRSRVDDDHSPECAASSILVDRPDNEQNFECYSKSFHTVSSVCAMMLLVSRSYHNSRLRSSTTVCWQLTFIAKLDILGQMITIPSGSIALSSKQVSGVLVGNV